MPAIRGALGCDLRMSRGSARYTAPLAMPTATSQVTGVSATSIS